MNRVQPRTLAWLLLAILVALGFSLVFIPAWRIQPFAPQTARDLSDAYSLRRLSPYVTPITAALVCWLVWSLWRAGRWWSRVALVFATFLAVFSAWFARQNHFEWMFRQTLAPTFAWAETVTFLADTDMVLGVDQNGEAAAYPVRFVAYHHLVHDRVGEVPIVATY